ncbi:MAG: hypothetical protein QNK04_00795 [Myxococcota bacterium]|nr:hypothetical protein [Myxococcota bacterium]
METPELPAVELLIPHRSPLLLLERVLEHDGERTVARPALPDGGWLHRGDGSYPAWLAVEFMAQCAAAHEGLRARAEGRALPRGFLTTAQGLRLRRASFAAGEQLRVEARYLRGRPGLGAVSYTCVIRAEGSAPGEALAEGRLSVAVEQPA